MRHENETRQKLLTTAVDLIWENSYHSVSVDDICKRAGVLKGSFYHFFPSKSKLTVAAYDEYWTNQRRSQLEDVFSARYPPLERLARYCEQVYETQRIRRGNIGRVCGCPFSALGSELSAQDKNIRLKSRKIAERICGYLASAIVDAIREGSIGKCDPAARARELYALVTGVLLQARIHNRLALVNDLKPAMMRLLGMKEARSAPM